LSCVYFFLKPISGKCPKEAKLNLELLGRVLVGEEKKTAGPGQGYSPGAIDKGY